jgi:hypothetical protein
MHSVELLERLESVAENAGYTVRHEWLGGAGGGACEFAGRKWIFVDLSLPVTEQLAQLAGALQHDPACWGLNLHSTDRHAPLSRVA